ncbi:MAG: hypothetical protein ACYSUB_16790 [Planctomycetota bacterium]|jgi:hypothetical protein
MSRVKYAIEPSFIQPWATRIGKLIINFADLEFESYLWLIQMSGQPERIQEFTKLNFASRVKKITEFAEALAFSERWRVDALAGWNDSLELANLRNRIAHNPLLFAWTNEAEKGEPDLIGVVDMKSGIQPKGTEGPLLSKADIAEAINQIGSLVSHLASLRKDWCTLRDKSKGDDNP